MLRTGVRVKRLVFLVLTACVSLAVSSCSIGSGCKDTVAESSVSPDGRTSAAATVANCGATSGFFTYVSIQTSDVPLQDDGVLFAYRGKPDLKITWRGPEALQVECTSQCVESKIYRQVVKEGQYTIQYSGFAP
jgi:hypothetical protein